MPLITNIYFYLSNILREAGFCLKAIKRVSCDLIIIIIFIHPDVNISVRAHLNHYERLEKAFSNAGFEICPDNYEFSENEGLGDLCVVGLNIV